MKSKKQLRFWKILVPGTLTPAPIAASLLVAGSVSFLAIADLWNSQAALAADAATPDDIIFDGNRLISPIPNSGGGSKQSVKAPQTGGKPVGARAKNPESANSSNASSGANSPNAAGAAPGGTAEKAGGSGSSQTNLPTSPDANSSKTNAVAPNAEYCAPADRMVRQAEKKIARELTQSEQDLTMYQQMSQVINWLNQYCVWNHHWPEPVEETNQAVNQLCELVPNNPYKWQGKVQEAQGQSTDPDYLYLNQPMNQPTDASTGFEGDSPDPGTSFEALGNKRIKLVLNTSLTAAEVRTWETDPPDEWSDDPGTITGISNSQNLIVVWGAGADGKPLKVPGSKKLGSLCQTFR